MNFSESSKIEKEIGFVSGSIKTGKCSLNEITEKFGDILTDKDVRKSKYTIVNGIPHKSVNGKLIPLTKLN